DLPAGDAVGPLLAAVDLGHRGIFAAVIAAPLAIGRLRRHFIDGAAPRIGPDDVLPVLGMFHDLADAVLVDLIHRAADGAADQIADDGAADDGDDLAIPLADLRAGDATRRRAENAAQHLAVAAAHVDAERHRRDDIVRAVMLAFMFMLVLVAIAMRRRPGRRIGEDRRDIGGEKGDGKGGGKTRFKKPYWPFFINCRCLILFKKWNRWLI